VSTSESRTKLVFNVYDFKRSVASGTSSKANIITAFKTAVLTPLAACLSVSYATDFIDCRWLDDPLDPYLTQALALPGTITGDSLPSVNNAYVQTGSGVRLGSNRGSKHFGPLAESSTTLDTLTSGAQTLFATFCAAWVAGFTSDASVYTPFIVSAKQSTLKALIANVVGVTMTSALTRPVVGLMRHRYEARRSSL
jgi:hypothetical protein